MSVWKTISTRILPVTVATAVLGGTLIAQEPGWVKHVPEADRTRTNPLVNQPDAAEAGQKLYGEKCARCHGAHGEGKGHSPSLQTKKDHDLTAGELEWVIDHGFSFHRMPAFDSLTQDQRWQIVSYVQSLPVSK